MIKVERYVTPGGHLPEGERQVGTLRDWWYQVLNQVPETTMTARGLSAHKVGLFTWEYRQPRWRVIERVVRLSETEQWACRWLESHGMVDLVKDPMWAGSADYRPEPDKISTSVPVYRPLPAWSGLNQGVIDDVARQAQTEPWARRWLEDHCVPVRDDEGNAAGEESTGSSVGLVPEPSRHVGGHGTGTGTGIGGGHRASA